MPLAVAQSRSLAGAHLEMSHIMSHVMSHLMSHMIPGESPRNPVYYGRNN